MSGRRWPRRAAVASSISARPRAFRGEGARAPHFSPTGGWGAAHLAPHKRRLNPLVPNKIGSPVGKDEFDSSRPVPNMAKRPGEPAEAAKAVLFLVTDDSSFVWGANLFVDGGVSAMDLS